MIKGEDTVFWERPGDPSVEVLNDLSLGKVLPDLICVGQLDWAQDQAAGLEETGHRRGVFGSALRPRECSIMIARMTETGNWKRKRRVRIVRQDELARMSGEAPPPTPLEGSARSSDWFGQFAAQASTRLGSKWAFAGAGLVILAWGATGPLFHYSDTWQLVINTGTTIVTFLMVFLIQNTQNRDARAINLKLDELIRAIDAARDQMIDIESLSDLELKEIQADYVKIKGNCAKPWRKE